MAKTKYKKLLVITPTSRGTPELHDIVNTYLDGIPRIKYSQGTSHYLVMADIGCISTILLNIWYVMGRHQMHTFYIDEYSHYRSEGGYCYFSSGCDTDPIVLQSKNLKVLWD